MAGRITNNVHQLSVLPLLVLRRGSCVAAHQQLSSTGLAPFTKMRFLFSMQREHYVQFFTATILEWKPLLKQDKYKQLILDSLRFLVEKGRVKVYGFTIMINHIHLIWHIQPGYKREDVQRDFLKYTAQQIKADLQKHHPKVLPYFLVNAKDRRHQIWERNPLSIDLWSPGGAVTKTTIHAPKPCAGRHLPLARRIQVVLGAVLPHRSGSLWLADTCDGLKLLLRVQDSVVGAAMHKGSGEHQQRRKRHTMARRITNSTVKTGPPDRASRSAEI
jgi:REP element-mobilizing transposase RayT